MSVCYSYGDIFYLDGVGMFVCDLDTMEKMFKMEEFSGRVDLNLVAKARASYVIHI